MVIPYAHGNVRVKFWVRLEQGHVSMLPRKDLMY